MKLLSALIPFALAVAATAAWGHPGHGAEGAHHHVLDFLALGGIAAVLAIAWAARKGGGNDHD